MIIADFESTHQGWIHSISYTPVQFTHKKQWKSRGRGFDPVYTKATSVTHGPVTTIVIRDIVTDPSVREMTDVRHKLSGLVTDAADLGQSEILVMEFKEALEKFLKDAGDAWLAHSIDNDIDFLVKTDQRLRTGLFPRDPKAYPNTCCRLADWSKVAKVCTQQILTRRCPNFWKAYGGTSARLCHLAEFVGCSAQTHTPARDVLDLFQVLARAYELDQFQVEEGCSYMICKPVQTYAPLNQMTL